MKHGAVCVLMVAMLTACDGSGEIPLSEASEHVGENRTLCGIVANSEYQLLTKSRPTYLELSDAESADSKSSDSTGHTFTAVIWGAARKNFPKAPEDVYRGKRVCVTGDIALYNGEPHMMLTWPDQIEVK